MLKSLMTGVSGVKVHQKRMDVVGNNIANVNTTGFKGSSVIFQDMLSQNMKGAMAPDQNRGGVNAQQIGTGVGVGAIETIHTQGTVSQTGNRTDMAIQGDGYFIVRSGQEDLYTRAGNFVLDKNSDLVMSGTGYKVQGNQVTIDEDGNEIWGSTLDDINIPLGKKMEAKATSTVGYRCNLDSRVDPYLPFGVPEGLKFSALDAKKTPYTIEVSEGNGVEDFLVVRVTNETDKSVEIFKFEFNGVQQSAGDESVYYPKFKDTDVTSFNSETGKMRIRDLEFPLGAYMNYQAVTIDDSTGTSHTYLAEVTEGSKDAVVRLWGQGKNEITGASQWDYFQWTVPKTEKGLFDPDSTLSISTGNDSQFPDELSIFMNVGSSGKTLNFRGNVNPIIGPATSNSVVNKDGNTVRQLSLNGGTVYDVENAGDRIIVNASMPSSVSIGDQFTLTLNSEGRVAPPADPTSLSNSKDITLKCTKINDQGHGVFQWYDNSNPSAPVWRNFSSEGGADPTAELYYFDAVGTAGRKTGAYTVSYDAYSGKISLDQPAGSVLPLESGTLEGFQKEVYTTAFSNMATNGNYVVGLKTPESYSEKVAGGTFSLSSSLPESVRVGETIKLTLNTSAPGVTPAGNANLDLKCISINASGNAVFQWSEDGGTTWNKFAAEGGSDPKISDLDYYNGTSWAKSDKTGVNYYTVGYNAVTGSLLIGASSTMEIPSATSVPTVKLKSPDAIVELGVGEYVDPFDPSKGKKDDFAFTASLPDTVKVGEEVDLTLQTGVTKGGVADPNKLKTVKLKCTGVNSSGHPEFQWYDTEELDPSKRWKSFDPEKGVEPKVTGLDNYDGGWKTTGKYTVRYDETTGNFTVLRPGIQLKSIPDYDLPGVNNFKFETKLPDQVTAGEVITLKLTTSHDAAGGDAITKELELRCASIDNKGIPTFEYYNGTAWVELDGVGTAVNDLHYNDGVWRSDGSYTVKYDKATGEFSIDRPAGVIAAPAANPVVGESIRKPSTVALSLAHSHVEGDLTLDLLLPPQVEKGKTVDLKLITTVVGETPETIEKTLTLTCTDIDDDGRPVFTGVPGTVSGLYSSNDGGGTWGVTDNYTVAYNQVTGEFTVETVAAGTPIPSSPVVTGDVVSDTVHNNETFNPFLASGGVVGVSFYQADDFQVPARADIGYGFKEGETIDDFITMTLDYPDASGISAKTEEIKLSFRGVSTEGNVILQPSPSTVNIPVADPDNPDKLTLQSHRVTYDPAKGTVSLVNEATGKSAWSYSNFKFQTTEINGVNYLVDYDSSGASDTTYGDIVTLWGPNDLGVMTPFKINTTDPEGLTYTNTAGKLVYGGSQTFDGNFSGGVKVTAKPSPTDPSRLIFTYDSNNGGKAITTIRENSASVHEGKGTIYDSLGNAHTMEVAWKKVGNNTWSWEAFFPDSPELALSENKGILRFSEDGKILSGGENTISVGFSAIGAADAEIVLDFSGKSFGKDEIEGVTQYGSAFTTKPYSQDGYKMGVLKDFSTSNDGTIVGVYDNGQNQSLYKVALAQFSNPQGLLKNGGTVFSKSINSGEPSIVNAMVGGAGSIAGASLEASNVDITDEFTNLITTQRGFQASSRVITTSDSMLEELLNLKR